MPVSLIARSLTVAAVVVPCTFAVVRGASMMELVTAREPPADPVNIPTASMALEAALDHLTDAGADASRRRLELLTRLLSVRPLSSSAWLSFSGMRLVTGEPYSGVLAALKMSALTGPNEASAMWQRGLFGLLQWESLPSDFQQRAILDLSGPMLDDLLDDRSVEQLRGVIDAKTPQVRAQVTSMLLTQGVDERALDRVGLQPTQVPQ